MESNQKKKRRILTVKFICAAIMLSLVIWVITLGWFTMNRTVESDGMAEQAVSLPFDIATTGELIEYKEKLLETDSGYREGISTSIGDVTYYKTDDTTDKLILRYDTKDTEIGPGDSGELSLYIIPKVDGDLDVDITLNISSFITIDTEDEEKLVEVNNSLTADSPGLDEQEIEQCKSAAKYLSGHIMFFEKKSESENFSYVNPLTDRKFHFHKDNAVAGTAYPINLQWAWPNTLGQIALKTNAQNLRNGTPVVEETADETDTDGNQTDKAKVIQYLKENKEKMFTNYDDINDNMIETADTKENFDLLSAGYNEADLLIGTTLNYFVIDVTVTAS